MSSLPLPGSGRDVHRRLLIALLTFALAAGGVATLDLAPAFASESNYDISVSSVTAKERNDIGGRTPFNFTITVTRKSSAPLMTDPEPVKFKYSTATIGGTVQGQGPECAPGMDLIAVPPTEVSLTFQPTGTPTSPGRPEPQTKGVAVNVCRDGVVEADEKFELGVTDTGATVGLPGIGTIENDDPFLTLTPLTHGKVPDEKTPTAVSFSEGDPSIGFEVESSGASTPIELTYTIAGGTTNPATVGSSCSTAGVDVLGSGTFTLPAGATKGSLILPVCPDDRDEFDETFVLTLKIKDSSAFWADGKKGSEEKQYTITLENDDQPIILIPPVSVAEGSAAQNTANKNNKLTFTLQLDRPAKENVTAYVRTEDGSAKGAASRTAVGVDYLWLNTQNTDFKVDIPASTGEKTVDVEIVGDDVKEGDETFFLKVVKVDNGTTSKKPNARIGEPGIGTILDDDQGPPAIGFPTPGTDTAGVESCDDHDQEDLSDPSDDVYAVCLDEGQDGQVTEFAFPVVLSHPSQSVVSVAYATADGTSTFNTGDYDKTEGTLQFEPGEIVKTITIDTNGDAFPGPNEHFFLRLSAPTGGTLRPAATGDPDPTSARGVVLNDDGPVIESEDAEASEPENGGTSKATFALWLSETSSQPVTVAYTTVSDTAKAGSDFAATQGTATIPAGSLKTEVPVTILGDDIVEGDETFFLQLSDAAGGTLRRAKLTGTIQDDGSTNRARALDLACPSNEVPSAGYTDVTGPTHKLAIDCLAWWEITTGKGDGTYNPGGNVTRAQMASFIARAMTAAGVELPSDPPDHFRDDNGSPHELAINQLTELGVVTGKKDGSYGAGERVGRGQTAALTARAYEVITGAKLAAGDDAFRDDDGTTHEDNIDRVAAAGIVTGKADGKFDAGGSTTRAQMASILMRLMDLLVEEEFATTPSSEPEPDPDASPSPDPDASPSPDPDASPSPDPDASPSPSPTPTPTPTPSP